MTYPNQHFRCHVDEGDEVDNNQNAQQPLCIAKTELSYIVYGTGILNNITFAIRNLK